MQLFKFIVVFEDKILLILKVGIGGKVMVMLKHVHSINPQLLGSVVEVSIHAPQLWSPGF